MDEKESPPVSESNVTNRNRNVLLVVECPDWSQLICISIDKTVYDVKKEIGCACKISPCNMHLYYKEQKMIDFLQLADYGLVPSISSPVYLRLAFKKVNKEIESFEECSMTVLIEDKLKYKNQ